MHWLVDIINPRHHRLIDEYRTRSDGAEIPSSQAQVSVHCLTREEVVNGYNFA
jgi:hypothetical protein